MRALQRAGAVVRLVLGFVAIAFCMAPVPGDVGGCGQTAEELDPHKFFTAKANIDCDRCRECGYDTQRCELACSSAPPETEFPQGCVPLAHDGDVCLRALLDASCEEYRDYVRDAGPGVPSECYFCPLTLE